jgi:pimeloyl-ACP methyl ester carboxylesterase
MTICAHRSPNLSLKLDPREEHFHLPSPHSSLSLFMRYLAPSPAVEPRRRTVLYVHGGTFPSAPSIAHRFDGRSWRDALCDAGFHVWALDFHGFGESDPYPEMIEPAEVHSPLGRAAKCSAQLEAAVGFICKHHAVPSVSLISHSWGTIVAGELAGRRPELVDRLVFFGPIARREPRGERRRLPGWSLISLQNQWDRFVADVPIGDPPVLLRRHFDNWGECYLDTEPTSRTRTPAAVKVPSGAFQDIYDAWAGELAYDPGRVCAPLAIIRGEWDSLCTDADARWLFAALPVSHPRRDIKIGRATHLMHLEENRFALYREVETFLVGGDQE